MTGRSPAETASAVARNGKSVPEEGYTMELLAGEAARLPRERDKKKPKLLYVACNAVHNPLQVPDRHLDDHSPIEDKARRTNAAMDTGIGRILESLHDERMVDDTLVLFMRDNRPPYAKAASRN